MRSISDNDLRSSIRCISHYTIHSLSSYYRFVRQAQHPWSYTRLSSKLELLASELCIFFSGEKIDPIIFIAYWYYIEGKSIRDISFWLQRDFQIFFPKNSLSHMLVNIFEWELRSNNSHETALSLQKHAKNGSWKFSIEKFNSERTTQKTKEVQKMVNQCIHQLPLCDLDEVAVHYEWAKNLSEKIDTILCMRHGKDTFSYMQFLQASGMSMTMIATFLSEIIYHFFEEVWKDSIHIPKITGSEVNKLLQKNKEER